MGKHNRSELEKQQRNLLYAKQYMQLRCGFCGHRTCVPGRCVACGERIRSVDYRRKGLK